MLLSASPSHCSPFHLRMKLSGFRQSDSFSAVHKSEVTTKQFRGQKVLSCQAFLVSLCLTHNANGPLSAEGEDPAPPPFNPKFPTNPKFVPHVLNFQVGRPHPKVSPPDQILDPLLRSCFSLESNCEVTTKHFRDFLLCYGYAFFHPA